MQLNVSVDINATRDRIWSVISDIEASRFVIDAIDQIEVLHPATSQTDLKGMKWRETRTMFGKTATEVMYVTESEENSHYRIEAESHGAVYKTLVKIDDTDTGCRLSYDFNGIPVTLGAKLAHIVLSPLFTGGTRKALLADLKNVKEFVEKTEQ